MSILRSFRFPAGLSRALDQYAKEHGATITEVVMTAIESELRDHGMVIEKAQEVLFDDRPIMSIIREFQIFQRIFIEDLQTNINVVTEPLPKWAAQWEKIYMSGVLAVRESGDERQAAGMETSGKAKWKKQKSSFTSPIKRLFKHRSDWGNGPFKYHEPVPAETEPPYGHIRAEMANNLNWMIGVGNEMMNRAVKKVIETTQAIDMALEAASEPLSGDAMAALLDHVLPQWREVKNSFATEINLTVRNLFSNVGG